mgnify:CR=1 FL=1
MAAGRAGPRHRRWDCRQPEFVLTPAHKRVASAAPQAVADHLGRKRPGRSTCQWAAGRCGAIAARTSRATTEAPIGTAGAATVCGDAAWSFARFTRARTDARRPGADTWASIGVLEARGEIRGEALSSTDLVGEQFALPQAGRYPARRGDATRPGRTRDWFRRPIR